MAKRKIQDDAEVIRWYEEGRTYAWMQQKYLEKYDIQAHPSMFSNFCARRGLTRRTTRDDDLIPWALEREHRWGYSAKMLRFEARRRAGAPLTPSTSAAVDAWRRGLDERREVVDYDPANGGWRNVPRLPEDDDIVRRPRTKTTKRRSAERGSR